MFLHNDALYRYGFEVTSEKVIGKTMFSMDEDESHGTQKFFYLGGPILDTLEKGKTLFIDEFDARLHPNLVLSLFSLSNTPSINTKGAQLMITAQNSIFLQSNKLRKDQIWFVEKDRFEAAHLYCLSDCKSNHSRKKSYPPSATRYFIASRAFGNFCISSKTIKVFLLMSRTLYSREII